MRTITLLLLLICIPQAPAAPERQMAVILTPDGAYPKSVVAFVGERVRFYITTTSGVSYFNIPEKDIYLSVRQGEVSETRALFDREGEFHFGNPDGGIQGKVVVLPRPFGEKAKIGTGE